MSHYNYIPGNMHMKQGTVTLSSHECQISCADGIGNDKTVLDDLSYCRQNDQSIGSLSHHLWLHDKEMQLIISHSSSHYVSRTTNNLHLLHLSDMTFHRATNLPRKQTFRCRLTVAQLLSNTPVTLLSRWRYLRWKSVLPEHACSYK